MHQVGGQDLVDCSENEIAFKKWIVRLSADLQTTEHVMAIISSLCNLRYSRKQIWSSLHSGSDFAV